MHLWIPNPAGTVAHAVPADRTVVNGWAVTACRPTRVVRLGGMASDAPRCANCVGAIGRVCGTYAGYQHHKKTGEQPCGPCRTANADYQRDLRRRNPELRESDRQGNNARSRALWRLADEYRARFGELVDEELARERASDAA